MKSSHLLATAVALASAAALVSLPASGADSASKAGIDKSDAAAMKKLAGANLAEVEAGKLAASKAQSEDVKKFGQQMADDHEQMLEDLKKLADARGVKLPEQAPAKERAKMKALEKLSPAQFDKRYMSEMVKDHQKDVKETADIANKAKDPELKAAVEDANAKIRDHLKMAQQVAQKS